MADVNKIVSDPETPPTKVKFFKRILEVDRTERWQWQYLIFLATRMIIKKKFY